MARGIDTKCIHLEEDEGQCSHYGALSYPILSDRNVCASGRRTEHRI